MKRTVLHKLITHLAINGYLDFLPDGIFLKLLFFGRMAECLNLKNPKTYNEKLQWLKLYYRKSILTSLVDKVEVKKYVANKIGEEYIIPTIGVFNTVEEIDWQTLPKKFVIKCTHDSGGIVVCKDKDNLNIEEAKRILSNGLKRQYFNQNREWPYKNVQRRLICEEYKEDESGYELKDYKWFCFDGVPRALFIATDRQNKEVDTKFDFFDTDFNHLPFTNGHPNSDKQINKPLGFDKMKELASILSKGFPHVRIDFYDINGQIFFGEMTFFHWSGMVPFVPKEWDYKFGEWINLPNRKIKTI